LVATWLGEVAPDAPLTTIDVTGVGFLAFALAEAIGYAAGTGSAIAQVVQGVLWLSGPEGTLFALAADGIASLGQRRRQMTQEEYDWTGHNRRELVPERSPGHRPLLRLHPANIRAGKP
jgi:hypothetical protein